MLQMLCLREGGWEGVGQTRWYQDYSKAARAVVGRKRNGLKREWYEQQDT
jgi:hypothetical protein